jgi:hypothetical protein
MVGAGDAAIALPEFDDAGAAPMDGHEAQLWAEAAMDAGDPEDRMRLADQVGCEGMRERATAQPELRMTAIAAMQYCRDYGELPWLARIAQDGGDAEARAALESIVELAARPRRATDPEDALELHEGCATLLDLARGADRPRDRRVLAVRALRMLAERGCVKKTDIPTELDAK